MKIKGQTRRIKAIHVKPEEVIMFIFGLKGIVQNIEQFEAINVRDIFSVKGLPGEVRVENVHYDPMHGCFVVMISSPEFEEVAIDCQAPVFIPSDKMETYFVPKIATKETAIKKFQFIESKGVLGGWDKEESFFQTGVEHGVVAILWEIFGIKKEDLKNSDKKK